MSMSTHVVGFAPPDEIWQKMKTIWDACVTAHVDVPEEVDKFFGYEAPDDAGVKIDLEKIEGACREFNDGWGAGFEIDVAILPKSIKKIRFFNSW